MKGCHRRATLLACAAAGLLGVAGSALADEGGVSFWLPGQMGSLSAVPGKPGFALPFLYYHTDVDAGGEHTFVLGGNVVAGIHARGDIYFFAPTYVFPQPVLDAQATVSVGWGIGDMHVSVDEVLSGPRERSFAVSASDHTTGGTDLYPQFNLKWHDGVHNWMVYTMADAPTGVYQKGRLANVGINHWALDAGGGYTYFDPKTGREFTAVAGLTYNWENHDTDYQNGVDGHIDLAASQFLSEQLHVGVSGYVYYQLTGDSGSGAVLGDNKARVFGAGPQIGYFFPVGKEKGYVNLRVNWDFGARNRPDGWNAFLTLALPLAMGG